MAPVLKRTFLDVLSTASSQDSQIAHNEVVSVGDLAIHCSTFSNPECAAGNEERTQITPVKY